MHKTRNIYKILIRKPEGKGQLRRSRHRNKDIRMDTWVTVWEGVDYMHLAQD